MFFEFGPQPLLSLHALPFLFANSYSSFQAPAPVPPSSMQTFLILQKSFHFPLGFCCPRSLSLSLSLSGPTLTLLETAALLVTLACFQHLSDYHTPPDFHVLCPECPFGSFSPGIVLHFQGPGTNTPPPCGLDSSLPVGLWVLQPPSLHP